MNPTQIPLDELLAAAREHYRTARWADAYELLQPRLASEPDELAAARCAVTLVEGYNHEDFKRGLNAARDKHALLDRAEQAAQGFDEILGSVHFQRGMTLHIQFAMAEPDNERELASFTRAAELLDAAGEREGAALARSMIGIFHHVNLLDRAAAEPLLRIAYNASPPGPSLARAEAARHLGQIRQELGDPAGALPMLEESLAIREQAGWELLCASALHAIGFAQLEAGDLGAARATLDRAREIAERLDAPALLPFILRTQADLMMATYAPNMWRRSHP